jgi:hypothetical protein
MAEQIIAVTLVFIFALRRNKKGLENPRPFAKKKPSAVLGLPTATFKKISGHERGRQTPLKKLKKTKKLSVCICDISFTPSSYLLCIGTYKAN